MKFRTGYVFIVAAAAVFLLICGCSIPSSTGIKVEIAFGGAAGSAGSRGLADDPNVASVIVNAYNSTEQRVGGPSTLAKLNGYFRGTVSVSETGLIRFTADANDAGSIVLYHGEATTTITTEGGSVVISVSPVGSSIKDMTYFAFLKADNPGLPDDFIGTINDTSVTVEVPVAAAIYALKPTITISGTSVSPDNKAPNDFRVPPVIYTVSAENGTTKEYRVFVNTSIPYATLQGTVLFPAPDPAAVGKGIARLECGSFVHLVWNESTATYCFFQCADVSNHSVSVRIDTDEDGQTSTGDYYGSVTGLVIPYTGTVTQDIEVTQYHLASVTGTIGLPAPDANANGKTIIVQMLNSEMNPVGSYISTPWGENTTESYTISDVQDGFYYVRAFIDMDGNNSDSTGDYLGWYGGSGSSPPQSANLLVSGADPISNVDIDIVLVVTNASVSGTVTIPSEPWPDTNYVIAVSCFPTFQNTGGLVAYVWDIWPFGKTLSYVISNILPGTYYLYAWVDVDFSNTMSPQDYVGYYGGSGATPPSSPNFTLEDGQSRTGIDITAGTME
jgi:hypothetical protein